MVSNFTEERLEELEELYSCLSPNHEGVNINTIVELLTRKGKKTPKKFKAKINAILGRDAADETEPIDFYHFCEIVRSMELKEARQKELKVAFKAMDTDLDGTVTIKEL